MKRLLLLCVFPALGVLATGCAAPAPTPRAFSHTRLAGVSREAAFDALHATMRERYRLATVDEGAGIIRSEPTESRESNNQGRVGDFVGVPRRVRKVVTGQVTSESGASDVWCKIVVQQLDTQAALLFENEMRLNDAPTTTAADRDAATTREQNEVWRTANRDRRGERELLRAVEESATGSSAASDQP